MRNRVSALQDGEIEGSELERAWTDFSASSTHRDWVDAWISYEWIGAAMRSERKLDFDVSGRVMAALESEPTVLAPDRHTQARIGTSNRFQSNLSALAAVVSAVMMVAWVALALIDSRSAVTAPGIAAGPQQVAKVLPVASGSDAAVPAQFRDYVIAHGAHASGGALAGAHRHVVAVSTGRGQQ